MLADQNLPNPIASPEFILPITQYRVYFSSKTARESVASEKLSQRSIDELNKSSIWRGVFGGKLKGSACIRSSGCEPRCQEKTRCLYGKLFETRSLDRDHLFSHLNGIPHPYVLYAHGFEQENNCYKGIVELTLFGLRSKQANAQIITSLLEAAQTGIGFARVPLSVDKIDFRVSGSELWSPVELKSPGAVHHHYIIQSVPECPVSVTLDFTTPLQIRVKGKLLNASQLEFRHLFSSTLRRISSLCAFYGEPLESDDYEFKTLTKASKEVIVADRNLRDTRGSRWSASQEKSLLMNGITGSMTLVGADILPFWPYLWIGSHLHIGKSATMGFGRFTIRDGQ